jgi:hypothetical protein
MRLSAKPIKNFANINNFDQATEWNIRKGEENVLYFQLVDLDKDSLRYMPLDPAYGVQVTFPALNSAGTIVKAAVQANVHDRSIWQVTILSNENPSSGSVQFSLTEGSSTKRFYVLDMAIVESLDIGAC